MSFDYSSFQQKLNNLLHNIFEIQNNQVKLLSPNPETLVLEYYDENGQLQQLEIPNYGVLKQQVENLVNNINNVMFKPRIYLDPINGDDNNDGLSEDKPVKTLQRAIDIIPYGGLGRIIMMNDVELNNDIEIKHKHVLLDASYKYSIKTKKVVRSASDGYTTYKSVYGIYVYGGLYTNALIYVDPTNPDGWNDAHDHSNAVSVFKVINGYVSVNHYHTRVDIPVDLNDCNLFTLNYEYFWWTHTDVSKGITAFFYTGSYDTDNKIRTNYSLIGALHGSNTPVGLLGWISEKTSIEDYNGNKKDIKNMIGGIVKDSNGVPRNVISNIIF